jgi:ribosomal-protein-alanine acetyltransferase
MKIRQSDRQDLYFIIAIQNRNPEAARWTEDDYSRLTSDPGGMILVAVLDTMERPKLVGFAAFRRLIDEAELLNMAIDSDHHHQGVGKALLEEARLRLIRTGTKRVFLEVRQSNRSALGLYYSAGFGLHSQRRDYYQDPPEDAYVLSLELFAPTAIPAST